MPIVVNSFSKYFAMTGWRLGWLLVPRAAARAVDCLTGNFTICPPVLSQVAAVAAFTPRRSRRPTRWSSTTRSTASCCSTGLPEIGIDRLAPTDGAFYVYADVSDFTRPTHSPSAQSCWPTPVLPSRRHRLRHHPRRLVRPAVLRRTDRRYRRGPTPHRCLAGRSFVHLRSPNPQAPIAVRHRSSRAPAAVHGVRRPRHHSRGR